MKTKSCPIAVKLVFSFFIAALIIYFSSSCTGETYGSSSGYPYRTERRYEQTKRKYDGRYDTAKASETTAPPLIK